MNPIRGPWLVQKDPINPKESIVTAFNHDFKKSLKISVKSNNTDDFNLIASAENMFCALHQIEKWLKLSDDKTSEELLPSVSYMRELSGRALARVYKKTDLQITPGPWLIEQNPNISEGKQISAFTPEGLRSLQVIVSTEDPEDFNLITSAHELFVTLTHIDGWLSRFRIKTLPEKNKVFAQMHELVSSTLARVSREKTMIGPSSAVQARNLAHPTMPNISYPPLPDLNGESDLSRLAKNWRLAAPGPEASRAWNMMANCISSMMRSYANHALMQNEQMGSAKKKKTIPAYPLHAPWSIANAPSSALLGDSANTLPAMSSIQANSAGASMLL